MPRADSPPTICFIIGRFRGVAVFAYYSRLLAAPLIFAAVILPHSDYAERLPPDALYRRDFDISAARFAVSISRRMAGLPYFGSAAIITGGASSRRLFAASRRPLPSVMPKPVAVAAVIRDRIGFASITLSIMLTESRVAWRSFMSREEGHRPTSAVIPQAFVGSSRKHATTSRTDDGGRADAQRRLSRLQLSELKGWPRR